MKTSSTMYSHLSCPYNIDWSRVNHGISQVKWKNIYFISWCICWNARPSFGIWKKIAEGWSMYVIKQRGYSISSTHVLYLSTAKDKRSFIGSVNRYQLLTFFSNVLNHWTRTNFLRCNTIFVVVIIGINIQTIFINRWERCDTTRYSTVGDVCRRTERRCMVSIEFHWGRVIEQSITQDY